MRRIETGGIKRGIDDAWRAAQAVGYPGLVCDTTLSSASLVSVLCHDGAGAMRITELPPIAVGLTFRLDDGSRVTSADIFASRPGALARVVNTCLHERLRKPTMVAGDEYIPKLPSVRPDDVAFGLGQNDARFIVPFEVYRHPNTQPEGRSQIECRLSYGELGLALADLDRP